MSLILDLIIQKFNLTYLLHCCAILYCTLVRLVSFGKENNLRKHGMVCRDASSLFEIQNCAPAPSDNQAYYMAPVWPTWFEGITAVLSDQTVRLNWALKTNSINQFFKILAPTPSNCSCLNEELAWKQLVIWVWGVRY